MCSGSPQQEIASKIEDILPKYGLDAHVAGYITNKSGTVFSLSAVNSHEIAKLHTLTSDIARELAVPSVSIGLVEGPRKYGIAIPSLGGVEMSISNLLENYHLQEFEIVLGKDYDGNVATVNLEHNSHILIGGMDSSGKTMVVNAILFSLLNSSCAAVRMMIIDSKRVEYLSYASDPHLLCPVVTDFREVASVLEWVQAEMHRRSKVLNQAGVQTISEYNTLVHDGCLDNRLEREELPHIVLVLDELDDFALDGDDNVEQLAAEILKNTLALGVHMIVATQIPVYDSVSPHIRDIPICRIACRTANQEDSVLVLGEAGAEELMGPGDILLKLPGEQAKRINGCFV